MSTRTYLLQLPHTKITLEVDVEQFKLHTTNIINEWGAESSTVTRLHAGLMLVANELCLLIMDGHTEEDAVEQLAQRHYYPGDLPSIITVVSHDLPRFSGLGWQIERIGEGGSQPKQVDSQKPDHGPSENQQLLSSKRLARLDQFFGMYGAYGDHWPEHAKTLWNEQEEYEANFC